MTRNYFQTKWLKFLYLFIIFITIKVTSGFAQDQPIEDYTFVLDDTAWVVADWDLGMHMNAGSFKVDVPGYYRMYVKILYDSGNRQLNESCYFTTVSPDSTPLDANAGPYKIVEDDGLPEEGHKTWRDVGLFYFTNYQTTVMLHHYAAIMDQYPEFLNGPIVLAESVKLPDSLKLVAEPFVDGALSITAKNKSGYGNDSLFQKGETIHYELHTKNIYRNSIRSGKILNSLPEHLQLSNFSLSPISQVGNKLEWELPIIVPGDSFLISFDATVPNDIQAGMTPILDEASLTVPNDIDTTNNFANNTVYSLFVPPIDGAIHLDVATDHSETVAGNPENVAYAGEHAHYTITVTNQLNTEIQTAQIVINLPSEFISSDYSTQPTATENGKIVWDVTNIPALDSIKISYTATLPQNLPVGYAAQVSNAQLNIDFDADMTNNSDTATFYSYAEPPVDGAVVIESITNHKNMVNGTEEQILLPGEQVTYKITVKNQLQYEIPSAQVVNKLPANITVNQYSVQPNEQTSDIVKWNIQNLSPLDSITFSFTGTLSQNVPYGFSLQQDEVELIIENDIDTTNNFDKNIIYSYVEPPVDGSIELTATTPHNGITNGNRVKVAFPGEAVVYQITFRNQTENSIPAATITNTIPKNITISETSIQPNTQTSETLIWELTNIAGHDSVVISFTGIIPNDVPYGYSPFIDNARLFIQDDVDTTNNFSTETIYSYMAPPLDGAVEIVSSTPDLGLIEGSLQKITYPEEYIDYKLTIRNVYQYEISSAQLIQTLPEGLSFDQFSLTPIETSIGKITWNLPSIVPQDSLIITFTATLADVMLPGINSVAANAELQVENDMNLANNYASDTVFYIADSSGRKPDFSPKIEALPEEVDVTENIQVRVQIPINTVNWDIWIYCPDGSIDSSFADNFISENHLTPGTWYVIDELYNPEHLISTQKAEELNFEIRTRNLSSNISTANAVVSVQSSNYLVLDRNVFKPEIESPLQIRFKLSNRRIAQLDVYDISGHHLVKLTEDEYEGGWNVYPWDGVGDNNQRVGSGVYLVTLKSGEFKSWKKFVIVR